MLLRSKPRRRSRKKIPRIAYLSSSDPVTDFARAEGIRLALRELGYIEGQNIAIEYRYSEGKRERFSALAAELVRQKVDIIVIAGGGPSIQAAKSATKTIPLVMIGSGLDPVEAGFVESLARPGGNVTGRVAVFYDLTVPGAAREVKEVLPAPARALKLTLEPQEIKTADDFKMVFAAMGKQRPNGLYVFVGPLMLTNRKRIAGFALKSRLPSVYFRKEFVDAGGLMSYGADLADSYRRVAYYVDRIVKG